jgi:hypothetical protein
MSHNRIHHSRHVLRNLSNHTLPTYDSFNRVLTKYVLSQACELRRSNLQDIIPIARISAFMRLLSTSLHSHHYDRRLSRLQPEENDRPPTARLPNPHSLDPGLHKSSSPDASAALLGSECETCNRPVGLMDPAPPRKLEFFGMSRCSRWVSNL